MKIEVEIKDEVMQFKQMDGFKDGIYNVEIKSMDTRTSQQHRTYYLWLTMIANKLNHDNITTQQVISPQIEWTIEKVKAVFTAPLIKTLFGLNTSTKMQKKDFDLLINTLTEALGRRGFTVPEFPSLENKEK